MTKLYYSPGACSLADHIVLEWIGKPYQAVRVSREERKAPAYLAINPAGAVPSRKPGGPGIVMAQPVELTVEAAMTGGQALPAAVEMGPQPRQTFELDKPLRDARDEFEKSYFEYHLAREGGSMTRVAEKTGLERTHLYRKLKQLGVDLSRGKRGGGA